MYGPWEADKTSSTQQLAAQELLHPSQVVSGLGWAADGEEACSTPSVASDGFLVVPNRVVVSQQDS